MIECYCIEQWNSKKFLDSLQKIMGKSFSTLIDHICLAHSEKSYEYQKKKKIEKEIKKQHFFLQSTQIAI